MVKVRKGMGSDAEQVITVMKNAEDSGFMLFSPGERKITIDGLAKLMDSLNNSLKSSLFVAVDNNRILGYIIVQNDKPSRVAHRAYLVIGVHSESRGKGVGTALFHHVLEWAKEVKLHRLELTVISTNDVAINLYKKMGFEVEGVKKHSLLIDDEYVDEYYMSILI
ncbi:GNAT family N-acetyltransferase [Lysinibacillus halotolerans]|uniref:GNAT family N-acetyltransferase n=1 Tax=Lysinibacillus halotolerans TaxID=1368476 RepID=A0A3M8H4T1_9BACI|nr:GNAT family N-acetyltransferase [Lysinibacillus halotolerans]RNC97435.1 GNAT family N-acetyltransferase [Lysinibacillus halotolerans]